MAASGERPMGICPPHTDRMPSPRCRASMPICTASSIEVSSEMTRPERPLAVIRPACLKPAVAMSSSAAR